MHELLTLKNELRENFYSMAQNRNSEEKFIEFFKKYFEQKYRFDTKALEVVLDLSLVVVYPEPTSTGSSLLSTSASGSSSNLLSSRDNKSARISNTRDESQAATDSDLSSYDADDEGLNETLMFPCHLNFDDCHPELLVNYHRERLKTTTATRSTTIQIIKYPRLCEFVFHYVYQNLKLLFQILKSQNQIKSDSMQNQKDESHKGSGAFNCDNLHDYLNGVSILFKRLNKVCLIEKKNVKILQTKTKILSIVLNSINNLICEQESESMGCNENLQHLYLKPMLKFAFTLADYKLDGSNLREIFEIIKRDQSDLKLVLSLFEQLLNHQFKIMKNLKPIKSVNFPTASKTAEEIELNSYISNSWHWRLRSQVMEFKRLKSRSMDKEQFLALDGSKRKKSNQIGPGTPLDNAGYRYRPSWLECSMIAPLSSISPLVQTDGTVKFCCSLWLSICGDLLVIEEPNHLVGTASIRRDNRKSSKRHVLSQLRSQGESNITTGSSMMLKRKMLADNHKLSNEYWIRLTQASKKRRDQFAAKMAGSSNSRVAQLEDPARRRTRTTSVRVRRRLANDKQDEQLEEQEEAEERNRRQLEQIESDRRSYIGIRRNNLSSTSFNLSQAKMKKSESISQRRTAAHAAMSPSEKVEKFLASSAMSPVNQAQEDLLHIITFALDTLTIEIWLNVKTMMFCAKACRVSRFDVSDEIVFQSHLQANGNWSHLMFCFQEGNNLTQAKLNSHRDKYMSLKVIVDGIYEEKGKLFYSEHKSPLANFALLLGCERSTYGYVWKLSQVNIYKTLPTKDVLLYLLGKGPDHLNNINNSDRHSSNTTNEYQQASSLPLFDLVQRSTKNLFSNLKMLNLYGLINENLILNWLTKNIVLAYNSYEPEHFLDYSVTNLKNSIINQMQSSTESGDGSSGLGQQVNNSAERFIQATVLNFSRSLKFNLNQSFAAALVEAGGIETILICFADIIRRANEQPVVHQLAFSILLKLSMTNQHHLEKFLDHLNGLELVEFILNHQNCLVTVQMLDQYLDYCLMKNPLKSTLYSNLNPTQGDQIDLIKSSKLIYHLLNSWRAWHKDLKVARRLYRKLISLLQSNDDKNDLSKQSYIVHNFNMMTNANSIDLLIGILRECLAPQDDIGHKINCNLIDLIVTLISLLIEHPPSHEVMQNIMEFLLFLHSDSDTYIETGTGPSGGGISYLYMLKTDYSSSQQSVTHDESIFRLHQPQRTMQMRESEFESNSSYFDDSDGFEDSFNYTGSGREDYLHQNQYFTNSRQSNRDEIPDVCENSREHEGCIEVEDAATNESIINNNNRNYAIANITDMLTSIIKSISSNSSLSNKTLAEIIQRPVIDCEKLVVLANNQCPLVREKVLRLFLYCIRACYNFNLKNVLNKYEFEFASSSSSFINNSSMINNETKDSFNDTLNSGTGNSSFKICVPFQLMAKQLLKYQTTIKTIQLCYGIIVGIEDFEAVELLCLNFDINSTFNNNLQLNCLLLVIKLVTNLQNLDDLIGTVKFIYSYLEKFIKTERKLMLTIVILSNLVESLMKLYFFHIRYDIEKLKTCENLMENYQSSTYYKRHFQLRSELDQLLIMIVKFYLQNLNTPECLNSIELLITNLDLINSHVPSRYKEIMRDRMVIILTSCLAYCRHYEEVARRRKCAGRIVYNLKSFLKNVDLNTFSNHLNRSHFKRHSLINLGSLTYGLNQQSGSRQSFQQAGSKNDSLNHDEDDDDSESSSSSDTDSSPSSSTSNLNKSSKQRVGKQSYISENNVIERFKSTLELSINFIVTREPDVIPSPIEREFVNKLIEFLAGHILELMDQNRNLKCHWSFMLPQLERQIRFSFTRLILYLLSPCESMNLDERKFNAFEIFKLFTVDQLLNLLNDNQTRSITTYRILNMFIKDLVDVNESISSIQSDANNGDCENRYPDMQATDDDELLDETENKLKLMGEILEQAGPWSKQTNGFVHTGNVGFNFNYGKQNGKALFKTFNLNGYNQQQHDHYQMNATSFDANDLKLRDIWLTELAQLRDDVKEKLNSLKLENSNHQLLIKSLISNATSDSSLASLIDSLNEKISNDSTTITSIVVQDKHDQRRLYLEDLKQSKIYSYQIKQQWLSLIINQTHERSNWYLEEYYPKSWELNPVEGPSRIRRRLRPCKLMLDKKFFRKRPKKTTLTKTIVENFKEKSRSFLGSIDTMSNSSNYRVEDEEEINFDYLAADDWYNQYGPHPLCSMVISQERSMDSIELRTRMFSTDKIHFNCDCSIIRPNEVCDGEISIASWCIHFIGERSNFSLLKQSSNNNSESSRFLQYQNRKFTSERNNCNNFKKSSNRSINIAIGNGSRIYPSSIQAAIENATTTIIEDLWYDEIVEIWDRRYQLQDVGLEIFLTNSMTYLISFRCFNDREDFKSSLMHEKHKMINLTKFDLNSSSLNKLTNLWRDGKLTNFDYLTTLNKLAGRSYNDLMQYPIFPFILSNYTTSILDLNLQDNFRKLKKPMAIQNPEKEALYLKNYSDSQSPTISINLPGMPPMIPYHYGNHYSNSATVLHYLVRLPPYTQMLIQYQDNNFDQPDRTFHSISNTWQLITHDSNTDFKELIPEFFYLPEMFTNFESFDLGQKQNNELVNDVKLPAWCASANNPLSSGPDARLFTLIHRQALESAPVSENLHHWIDLIFGYKQTGKPAVEAINVFHPATYYGMIDLNSSSTVSGGSGNGGAIRQSITTDNGQSSGGLKITSASNSSTGSITPLRSAIANVSAKSNLSNYSSDYYLSLLDTNEDSSINGLTGENNSRKTLSLQLRRQNQQANIDRLALETMIKTYGQMPRQLFGHPTRQRSYFTFSKPPSTSSQEQEKVSSTTSHSGNIELNKRIEPLRLVKGLKWGSFVGSPDEKDITAVDHKRITPDEYDLISKGSPRHIKGKHRNSSFNLCLLPNGDVVIFKQNTSLILDYRADRKSSGDSGHRFNSRGVRGIREFNSGNLDGFNKMIISRQQFGGGSQTVGVDSQLDRSQTILRSKFNLNSLSLVSWNYLDGILRIRRPALNTTKSSVPLLEANSTIDSMTTCCSVPELNLLLVGYKSGSICAHIITTVHETVLPANSSSNQHHQLDAEHAKQMASKRANLMGDLIDQSDQIAAFDSISMAALSSTSAAPSAVHFLHTASTNNSSSGTSSPSMWDLSPLPPLSSGKIVNSSSGNPYSPLSFVGKTLHTAKSTNRTTRWLYCHSKSINCIKINVSFGIIVTGSNDGTAAIWDLNSLTYVRTIDFKLKFSERGRSSARSASSMQNESGNFIDSTAENQRSNKTEQNTFFNNNAANDQMTNPLLDYLCGCGDKQGWDNDAVVDKQCCICASGVSLIAISDTLGDIVTVKNINNRLGVASDVGGDSDVDNDEKNSQSNAGISSDESESNLGDFPGTNYNRVDHDYDDDDSQSSIVYAHTINGALINFINCNAKVTAVCYSNAPEGVSVNVIVVGLSNGLIRLYSSWDLSRVKEFHVSGLDLAISSLLYSRDNQLLYITYEDGQLVILRNKNKRSSGSLLKEWHLC